MVTFAVGDFRGVTHHVAGCGFDEGSMDCCVACPAPVLLLELAFFVAARPEHVLLRDGTNLSKLMVLSRFFYYEWGH
tara:strand:- start:8178 stop:8408 length:231 start_codon:yes stop_codon:yes gene_type:complete